MIAASPAVAGHPAGRIAPLAFFLASGFLWRAFMAQVIESVLGTVTAVFVAAADAPPVANVIAMRTLPVARFVILDFLLRGFYPGFVLGLLVVDQQSRNGVSHVVVTIVRPSFVLWAQGSGFIHGYRFKTE